MCARRAVVLAGGGSRGAYQVGVWQAMKELGMDYQIVTGTSVGALNGAMLVQGDYEQARRMWLRLTAKDIANVDLEDAQQAPVVQKTVRAQIGVSNVCLVGEIWRMDHSCDWICRYCTPKTGVCQN